MDTLTRKISQIDPARLPRHVAIIMDGNGRWARAHGLDRTLGHVQGVKSVRMATEFASDIGIKYLTLYAFSTENWHRPQAEVDALMHLIGMAIEQETPDMIKNNVHLEFIGDIQAMPAEARSRLMASKAATAACTGLTMVLALNYSGRSELTRAARRLAEKSARGELRPDDITEETITEALDTRFMPDPDLMIRTGGECRISNYLLWQNAYAELCFTPTLWPDFGKEAFADALIDYQGRQRRFGMTEDQILGNTSTPTT